MKEWHLGNKTKEIQGASRGTPLGIGETTSQET